MKRISEFCRLMQASLRKREQAKTEQERIDAIQEMAQLIRENFTGQRILRDEAPTHARNNE